MKMIGRHSSREWWRLVNDAASAWTEYDALSMGAAFSYYRVFSMAPLLVIVIAIAGLVFGAEAARGEVFGQLRDRMGDDSAKAIGSMLDRSGRPWGLVRSRLLWLGMAPRSPRPEYLRLDAQGIPTAVARPSR